MTLAGQHGPPAGRVRRGRRPGAGAGADADADRRPARRRPVLPATTRLVATPADLPDVLDELLPFDVRVPGGPPIWAHHRRRRRGRLLLPGQHRPGQRRRRHGANAGHRPPGGLGPGHRRRAPAALPPAGRHHRGHARLPAGRLAPAGAAPRPAAGPRPPRAGAGRVADTARRSTGSSRWTAPTP